MKIIATNKKALFNYERLESFEAGIALLGSEVKSVREGKISLKESYAEIKGKEIFLINCHISPYKAANIFNHEPLREKKLLLHKREIKKLTGKIREKGYTLIPTQVKINIELALAKGKRAYQKRETIKERERDREMRAELKRVR